MARRSKLTPKVQEDFCAALQIGATIEIAAGYAGVTDRTAYGWLARGRTEEERLADPTAEPNPDEVRYLQFFQTAREAGASAAVSWLQVLENAMRGKEGFVPQPGFAMEMLERRYPKDFGKQARVDVTTGGLPFLVVYDEPVKKADEPDGPEIPGPDTPASAA